MQVLINTDTTETLALTFSCASANVNSRISLKNFPIYNQSYKSLKDNNYEITTDILPLNTSTSGMKHGATVSYQSRLFKKIWENLEFFRNSTFSYQAKSIFKPAKKSEFPSTTKINRKHPRNYETFQKQGRKFYLRSSRARIRQIVCRYHSILLELFVVRIDCLEDWHVIR